jgi:hypothetical protein
MAELAREVASMAVRHVAALGGCCSARGWTIMLRSGVILAKNGGDVVKW